jgi:hypothetical protein
MPFIRRHWTALEADEWTREDWLTILISPIVYVLLTVGLALTIALQWWGYVMLGVGIVLTVVMHWIIDPKLKAVSEEYEKRQQEYLKELEAKARWKSL